jgi:hypothetical protein
MWRRLAVRRIRMSTRIIGWAGKQGEEKNRRNRSRRRKTRCRRGKKRRNI